jgi:hypothetical protein
MSIKTIDGYFDACQGHEADFAMVSRQDWEAVKREVFEIDRIVQVSGFGVENTYSTQCNYILVGLTESGKVIISTGDSRWADVSPRKEQTDD